MKIFNLVRNYPKMNYVLLLWPFCMLYILSVPFKIFFQPTAFPIFILPFIYLKTSNDIDKNKKSILLSSIFLGFFGLILTSVFLGQGLTSGENGEINYEIFGQTVARFVAGTFYFLLFCIHAVATANKNDNQKLKVEDKAA